MAIGYKTTNYDTCLTNLTHQKMSYAKFDSTYVQNYIANKTPFEAAMQDVKANFGTHYFLERREIGMFNIGKDSTGIVVADGVRYELGYKDCLYTVSYTHLPPCGPD